MSKHMIVSPRIKRPRLHLTVARLSFRVQALRVSIRLNSLVPRTILTHGAGPVVAKPTRNSRNPPWMPDAAARVVGV